MTFVPYRAGAHRSDCLAVFESNVGGMFHPDERPDYEAFLDALPGPYFVSLADGVVATAGGWAEEEPGVAAVCWTMVARSRQGRGEGTALHRHLLADAAVRGYATCRLETVPATVGFFERLGFVVVAHDPDGYGPGRPRVEMRRTPPP